MVIDITTATLAGVSEGKRSPFASMEINDQINGKSGVILDDIADSKSLITKQRVLGSNGVLGKRVERSNMTANING